MSSVTEADVQATNPIAIRIMVGDLTVEQLHEAFATHREAAVKAERDRIVAWLRKEQDGRTSDNYALYFAKRIEALESQP